MHVQLLLAEAVRLAAARQVADLGAQDVAVEGVGAGGVRDGDDGVVEPEPRRRGYRIASSSGVMSRWKTSMSTSGFSASAGMRPFSASSYVGSSAW